MTNDDFGRKVEIFKANKPKPRANMSKPSAGRMALGTLTPGVHSLVAGKKGYKLRSFGHEAGGALGGALGGGALGVATSAGLNIATKGRVATAAPAFAGYYGGAALGGAIGTASAHRKGYLKKQPGR